MTQERYFDWMAPVGSKKASEPFALSSGIGLKHGLNKIEVIARQDNGKYLLSLSNNYSLSRDQYITDKANIPGITHGSIITPDGILTNLTSSVELPEVDIPLANEFSDVNGTYFEVAIVASHLYVEDSTLLVNTIFRTLPNRSSVSILATVYPTVMDGSVTKTMDDWYNHPNFSGLNKSLEVILGVAKIYRDNELHQMINIYNNEWPAKVSIPDYQWAYVNNLIIDSQKHLLQKRMVQEWYGYKVEEIPFGWVYCGSWYFGYGADSAITRKVGPNVSDIQVVDRAFLNSLVANFNTEYGLTGASAITVRTLDYNDDLAYILDFGDRTINGVMVPNITGRFTMNSGRGLDGLSNLPTFFDIGTTGGASMVKLTSEQSGLPNFSIPFPGNVSTIDGTGDQGGWEDDGPTTINVTGKDAMYSHENKPPFFTLPKIIKVI